MSRAVGILPAVVLILCAGKVAADVIDGEELVDPTRPFYFEATAGGNVEGSEPFRNVVSASYEISFIRASDSSPMAIINQQRVTLGDVIGGATVITIDRNGVTLLINEEEQRINLYSGSVKSPARNR